MAAVYIIASRLEGSGHCLYKDHEIVVRAHLLLKLRIRQIVKLIRVTLRCE